MAKITDISKALNSPIFEIAMRKIGYELMLLEEYNINDFWFQSINGDIIFFDRDSMQYICYTKARTISLKTGDKKNG